MDKKDCFPSKLNFCIIVRSFLFHQTFPRRLFGSSKSFAGIEIREKKVFDSQNSLPHFFKIFIYPNIFNMHHTSIYTSAYIMSVHRTEKEVPLFELYLSISTIKVSNIVLQELRAYKGGPRCTGRDPTRRGTRSSAGTSTEPGSTDSFQVAVHLSFFFFRFYPHKIVGSFSN